jgi:hypothetical protein
MTLIIADLCASDHEALRAASGADSLLPSSSSPQTTGPLFRWVPVGTMERYTVVAVSLNCGLETGHDWSRAYWQPRLWPGTAVQATDVYHRNCDFEIRYCTQVTELFNKLTLQDFNNQL